MRGSSVLPAFTPRMPPQPSSMSCALSNDSTSKPYRAPSSTATSAMADAVRCPGGPLARSRATAAARLVTTPVDTPAATCVDVGAVEGQHQVGQRLLRVGRAQRGEPVARQQGALGGRLPGGRRDRHRSPGPGCRAARRCVPWHGRRRPRHPARRPRRARRSARHRRARARGAPTRATTRLEPIDPSKPAAVSASRSRSVPRSLGRSPSACTSTATASRADGSRAATAETSTVVALRRHRAVVGGDQQAGVAGHRVAPRVG